MIKVACIWLRDVLNLIYVVTNKKGWKLESVKAMLRVSVNMTGEAKSVLRRRLGVAFEDDPCPPLVTMVPAMVARLALFILNHNLTFLIHKGT